MATAVTEPSCSGWCETFLEENSIAAFIEALSFGLRIIPESALLLENLVKWYWNLIFKSEDTTYVYIWKKNSDTTLQYVYFSLIFHLLFTQG